MSDSASQIASDAKSTHQSLKELLKTHHPWDKEVEFQRKSLRRLYLRLLFILPYAKESKDAETHLWMQTSYQFIATYKQSVATLERSLQSAPRHQPRQGNSGPVEYRRLMQRFRQFLAEEEKFWMQLVARYQRSFALHEALPMLSAMNITIPDDPSPVQEPPHNSRNQHQFPSEGISPLPTTPTDRESILAILSKAIVCLGDMARYRELYNEGGGRPRAGHEDGAASSRRVGRNRRPGPSGFDSIPRARNYDRAILCYDQARFLVPSEGNPSHQLAILAFYQNDMFSSLLHYYRALCVRQPYDTASENVKKILNKSLDHFAKKTRDTAPEISDQPPPRMRVESFKEKVVLLHALWRLGSDKTRLNPVTHAADVISDFSALVSDRVLPIETLTKVVVLSEGALWKHRTIRDTSPPSNRRSGGIPDPAVVESQILKHILAIHQSLLNIGTSELSGPQEDTAGNDLAQRITAPFRRTLPALRVASKWLLANIKYVAHATSPTGTSQAEGVSLVDISDFWRDHARFYNILSRQFPADRLPALLSPLDEDMELRGFLPLRHLMIGDSLLATDTDVRKGNGVNTGGPQARGSDHPNEEQLMRIYDLLKDARDLAESPDSPIKLRGNMFKCLPDTTVSSTPPVIQAQDIGVESVVTPVTSVVSYPISDPMESQVEEDAMTDTGRTDNDDPVGDAFNAVLNAEEHSEGDELDDELEVVVYPRASVSPPGAAFCLPTTPVLSANVTNSNLASPSAPTVISPGRTASGPLPPPPPPASAGTTAETLLKSFYNAGSDVPRSPRRQPVPPPSQFLFGSGPSNAPLSIWSTAFDQNPNLSPRTASVSQALPAYGLEHNLSTAGTRGTHLTGQPPSLSTFTHSPFESVHDGSHMHVHHPASLPFGPGHHRPISHSAAGTIQSSPSYQTTPYGTANHRLFGYPQEPLYLGTEMAANGFPLNAGLQHVPQGAFNPYPIGSSPQQSYARPMQHYPASSVWGNVG